MTAKEKLLEWLRKQVAKEKDKWKSGMKNQFFEFEDLLIKVEDYLK